MNCIQLQITPHLIWKRALPSRRRTSTNILAFRVGGITGPITVPGFTTTTSKPFSFANSQAAFSANVFESGYHNWFTTTGDHIVRTKNVKTWKRKCSTTMCSNNTPLCNAFKNNRKTRNGSKCLKFWAIHLVHYPVTTNVLYLLANNILIFIFFSF